MHGQRTWCGRIGLAVLCIVVLNGVPTRAVPAAPVAFTLTQPSGVAFAAHVVGDEWGNWMEASDGYTILFDDESGTWVYATRDAGGSLIPGGRPVGDGLPSGDRHLRPPAGIAAESREVEGSRISYAPPILGTHSVLVIFTDFTPSALVGTTPGYWSTTFFGAGPGCVDDYYREVSYGQLSLIPAAEIDAAAFGGAPGAANDGIVYVQLPYPHPNPATTGDTNRAIVRDAIIASDPAVNYALSDANGDGYLSTDELHIVTVVAGYEESFGGTAYAFTPNVWAHRWSLGWGAVASVVADGVVVGDWWGGPAGTMGGYTQAGEWHAATWPPPTGTITNPATIGVLCHELGHDMGSGVPDLYDTDGSCAGIGEWCLQSSGSWNGVTFMGDTPAHWCAWAKWMMGLLAPTLVTTNTNDTSFPRVETAGGANHGVYQVLNNPSGVDWDWGSPGGGEYFLLENRQQFGYDSALPGAGLCIWHVDENVPGDNTANADEGSTAPGNPRLVALEQMDGNYDLEGFGGTNPNGINNRGDATDPWVFPHGFDDKSTPDTALYGGGRTWVSIIDISASGATMTADIFPAPPATAGAFRVSASGSVLADQTIYAGGFQVGDADVAEWVTVSEPVEPGDVLELDPRRPGQYRVACEACSPSVAGIVSTDPGLILGREATGRTALLALAGFVLVKACDEGGPIRAGDLLVTASRSGYVRRRNSENCGFVVGKAIEPLIRGEGLILVLIAR